MRAIKNQFSNTSIAFASLASETKMTSWVVERALRFSDLLGIGAIQRCLSPTTPIQRQNSMSENSAASKGPKVPNEKNKTVLFGTFWYSKVLFGTLNQKTMHLPFGHVGEENWERTAEPSNSFPPVTAFARHHPFIAPLHPSRFCVVHRTFSKKRFPVPFGAIQCRLVPVAPPPRSKLLYFCIIFASCCATCSLSKEPSRPLRPSRDMQALAGFARNPASFFKKWLHLVTFGHIWSRWRRESGKDGRTFAPLAPATAFARHHPFIAPLHPSRLCVVHCTFSKKHFWWL
jgi:hypothetical protein